jgi:hypothetical protein
VDAGAATANGRKLTCAQILIDPEKRSITEIQVDDDYRAINAVLGCHTSTTGAHLGGTMSSGFDSILVSDDLIDERDDPLFWFQVDANRDPPSSHPIVGRGLAVGTDRHGDGCDARANVGRSTSADAR